MHFTTLSVVRFPYPVPTAAGSWWVFNTLTRRFLALEAFYCCFWFFWRIQNFVLSYCLQAKFNQISNQPLILNFLLWVILLFYPADCPLPLPLPAPWCRFILPIVRENTPGLTPNSEGSSSLSWDWAAQNPVVDKIFKQTQYRCWKIILLFDGGWWLCRIYNKKSSFWQFYN